MNVGICFLFIVLAWEWWVADASTMEHGGDVHLLFLHGGHWDYLLGQVINTAHHLILLDYLREEYGIMSHLHLQLLHHHFQKLAREGYEDRESLHAQGLITFEYQKLGGDVGEAPPFKPPREEIGQSYRAAQKHFGRYHPRAIPSCLSYQNDILSLLEDLEYARQHFLFFPSTNSKEEEELPGP